MDYGIKSSYNTDENRWDVKVSGEVDIFNSTAFKEQLIQLTNVKEADLCLDCSELTYMDSTALGALVAVLRNVKEYNGVIFLQNMRHNLAKLFKITGLNKVFEVEGEHND